MGSELSTKVTKKGLDLIFEAPFLAGSSYTLQLDVKGRC